MNFRDYFSGLSNEDKNAFAARCNTSSNYIQVHYMSSPPRKVPRRDRLDEMAAASNGQVSYDEIINHFFYPPAENSCSAA